MTTLLVEQLRVAMPDTITKLRELCSLVGPGPHVRNFLNVKREAMFNNAEQWANTGEVEASPEERAKRRFG